MTEPIDRVVDCCDYCHLPLPAGSRDAEGPPASAGPREPAFCCYGCRFAADVTRGSGEEGAARWTLTRLGLAVFFAMNVMVFTMALWTLDLYEFDAESRMAVLYHGLFRHLSMLTALPVLFLLGLPLFESSLSEARQGRLTSDLLLSTGVAAAFAYSIGSVLLDRGQVYFEVGCTILVLVTFGRWLEATGKLRTTEALERLEKLLPERVRKLVEGREDSVPLAELAAGDLIRVLPGERFPTDGRLEDQSVAVDEQILTGESRPVVKQPGDPIHGGTLNLDGDVRLVVTAAGGAGTLERLVEMVRRARASKGRYQKLADRTSAAFFPIVVAVATAAFAGHGWRNGPEAGLLAGLAVILIACPCALALATPMAIWTALGRASQQQVLFRSGEALERLAEVSAIRFDKTGTLTTGSPTVSGLFLADPGDREEVLDRAARLAASSDHSLSRAIREHAGWAGGRGTGAGLRVVPGRGVAALLYRESEPTCLGNDRFLVERGLIFEASLREALEQASRSGLALAAVGWAGRARGLFTFDEELRPFVVPVLSWCGAAGMDAAVLTGDHALRGEVMAGQLGVRVEAGLLPEDKVEAIGRARAAFGTVAMVGDGINDAPALAASDVGIAMGCGADVSRESAQVCLLGDGLDRIPWSIDLARRTVRVVRQNLAWAFGYNSLGMAAAALGWLNPAFAAFLMVASSLLVIGNSLRLGRVELAFDDQTAAPAVPLAARPEPVGMVAGGAVR